MKKNVKVMIFSVLTLGIVLIGVGGISLPGHGTEAYAKEWSINIADEIETAKFKATSSTTAIQTQIKLRDPLTGITTKKPAYTYTVTLMRANGIAVGSYTGKADDIYGGKSFNVTKGSEYYIRIKGQKLQAGVNGYRYYGKLTASNVE